MHNYVHNNNKNKVGKRVERKGREGGKKIKGKRRKFREKERAEEK